MSGIKLRLEQLTQHLQKSCESIYVISGDDLFQLQQASLQIQAAAKQQGFAEIYRYQVDTHFDWENFEATLQTPSLFADRRIMQLDLTHSKPGKTGGEILQKYSANPMPDILLIVLLPKLDQATQKTNWFKNLEKNAVSIQIWPVNATQMPQWIRNYLKTLNLELDNDAIQFLSQNFENNLADLAQELEKLKLLYDKNKISTHEVISASHGENHYNIFDLSNAVLAQDATKAILILETLRKTHAEPILILWTITRDIKQLIELAHQQKPAGLWPQRETLLKNYLKKISVKHLYDCLFQACEVDKVLKGATVGNVWDKLSALSLSLLKPA